MSDLIIQSLFYRMVTLNLSPLLITVIVILIIIQLTLEVAALIDLYKRRKNFKDNLVLWLIIIIFVNTIGPIIYFAFAPRESAISDENTEWNDLNL